MQHQAGLQNLTAEGQEDQAKDNRKELWIGRIIRNVKDKGCEFANEVFSVWFSLPRYSVFCTK